MSVKSVYTIPVTNAIVDVLLPRLRKTISYISPAIDLTNVRSFLLAVINPLVIGFYDNTVLNTPDEFDAYTKQIADNIGQIYNLSENNLAVSYLQTDQVVAYSISKQNLYDAASNTVDRTSQTGKKIYIEGTATHIIETPDFTYSTVTVPETVKGLYRTTLDAETNIPISSEETEVIQYKTIMFPAAEVIGNAILGTKVASAIRVLVTDPSYNLPIFEESSTIGVTNNSSLTFLFNVVVTNIGCSSILFSARTGKVVSV